MSVMRDLFVGKSVRVLRVLLAKYPKAWNMRELSKETNVSLRWAAVVCKALINEKMASRDSQRSEIKLMSPFDLLRRWANVHNFIARTKFLEFYTQEEDIAKFLGKFKNKKGPEYALTCLAGALKAAPYVRPTNVHVYVKSEEGARNWAGLLGLMPIEENGNVKFAIPEDPGVFYDLQEIDGVKLVSDVQLYVDLLNYPSRGEEAAQAVLKVIEKKWKGKNG